MTNIPSADLSPENVVHDIHQIRESIVESFGGDLHALTRDARARQARSSHSIWRGHSIDLNLAIAGSQTDTSSTAASESD